LGRACSNKKLEWGFILQTNILECNCESEYQDEKYGKFKRLFNKVLVSSKHGGEWRCTVCGKIYGKK
jgi:uncharacterized protein YjhX (UPF0386 family)